MLDEVLVTRSTALGADAAAVLRAVFGQRGALDVAHVRDGDDHVVVGIEILGVELLGGIDDLRTALVAVFSLISSSSSLMICICMPTFSSTSFRWAINLVRSSRSAVSLPYSSPVRARRRISMMAEAWMSLSSKRSIMACLAASGVCDERMMCTISSMLSCAIKRPSTICRRSSALRRS